MKIVNRLVALGLPRATAERLESKVVKWVTCSGPEWTVMRLKSLKVELLNMLAGRQLATPWVRRNSSGLPEGVFAELFRMALESKKGRFKAINSLMVYSQFISEKVTNSQRSKFFGTMESTDTTGLSVRTHRKRKLSKDAKFVFSGEPWVNAGLSPDSFQPGPDGKSYPETDTFISLIGAACSDPLFKIMTFHYDVFNEVVPMHEIIDLRRGLLERKDPVYDSLSNQAIGKISYIQEPGFKLRAVANPHRVLQAALEPLKEVLGFELSDLPNDFTFEQHLGVQRVQGWLKAGRIVHSVDLSDATNMFPLGYTLSVLLNRVNVAPRSEDRYRSLVEIFRKASISPWFSKESGVVSLHRFTRGQPLGLGPSFFAFALSHNYLLFDLCQDLGIDNSDSFAILGDDICIANDQLAEAYKLKLAELGCLISDSKSMTSGQVAEFAGKIIFSDEIIPQYKWRDLDDANFIDFCRNVGPSSLSLLSMRQRSLVNELAEIPDFIGGLGWNPNGFSLEMRLELPLAKFLMERDLEVSLPLRRVDDPLVCFTTDPRIKDLPRSLNLQGHSVRLIPSRDYTGPRWGTKTFWNKFQLAQNSTIVLPKTIKAFSDDQSERPRYHWVAQGLYIPYYKDVTNPVAADRTPWFDIIRLFRRSQSSLTSTH